MRSLFTTSRDRDVWVVHGLLVSFIICVFGLFWPTTARAAETAKYNTEDAPPVDTGVVEVELAYGYQSADKTFDTGSDLVNRALNSEHAFSLAATYGVWKNLDVGVGFSWAALRDDEEAAETGNGIGDIELGGKWLFHQSESEEHFFSFSPGFVIPIGETSTDSELGPGQDYWSFGALLVYSYDLKRWTFSSDFGYDLPFGGGRGSDRGTLVADFALGYQLWECVQPAVELNLGRNFQSGEEDSFGVGATLALIVNITDAFRADIGLYRLLFGENEDRVTSAGINLSYSI